jgi:putative transposase
MAERQDRTPSVGRISTLKKQFWGRHLWARGYFCCSSGNVTDDVIVKYIAEQNVDQDEDFKVDG